MNEERKKPCWAFRMSMASIVLLFGYPTILVPLERLTYVTGDFPEWLKDVLRAAYFPLGASVFGISFAAFCVWLVARIVNRRERWAKWSLATVAGLPILYFASLGPLGVLIKRESLPEWTYPYLHIYLGPSQLAWKRSEVFRHADRWYARFGTDDPNSRSR
jgi:hypothetical protein